MTANASAPATNWMRLSDIVTRERPPTPWVEGDALTGDVTRHAASYQAYTEAEYRALLKTCGFGEIAVYPSLMGTDDPEQAALMAIVGTAR